MEILSLALLSLLTLFLLLYCGSMVFHMLSTIVKKRAPFVPSSRRMLDKLPELIQPDATSFVYDLGCGDGRILRSLYHHFPKAHYIGVENDLFPYLLALAFNWRISANRLTIKRKNFFTEDLSRATHIITYLFPEVMDQLLPKLEKELRSGTMLVSFDFEFTNKKPERIVSTPELGRHKIFVYIF